jgi:hypothetical protein
MKAVYQHTFGKHKYSKIVAHNTRQDTEKKNINGKRGKTKKKKKTTENMVS